MIPRLVPGKHSLPIRYWIRGMLVHLIWWYNLILVAKIRVNPIWNHLLLIVIIVVYTRPMSIIIHTLTNPLSHPTVVKGANSRLTTRIQSQPIPKRSHPHKVQHSLDQLGQATANLACLNHNTKQTHQVTSQKMPLTKYQSWQAWVIWSPKTPTFLKPKQFEPLISTVAEVAVTVNTQMVNSKYRQTKAKETALTNSLTTLTTKTQFTLKIKDII